MTQLKNITLANGTRVLEREFNWDSRLQGYVLSSFYYGYILTQLLGGYMAKKFGGARVFGAGIASTAVFTLFTPWIAKTNVYFLIAARSLEGLFEGVTYPSILQLWAHWAPPLEKTRITTIAFSGAYVGNVIVLPVSSMLATAYGWETVFYVFGIFTLIWYLIWLILVKDSPEKDSRISPSELRYIRESINMVKTDKQNAVPWSSLFSSTSVWAISVTLTCEGWGWFTMATFLPQMMNSLLGYNLNKSGFLAALPYIAMSISTQSGGQLGDWVIAKKYLNTTQIRRTSIVVGFISQAIFLLSAAFWISPATTPAFLTLGAVFGGFALSGIMVNALDIAPKLASVIYGISNTFATIPGIVSPILTGYIVRDSTSIGQWRVVFYITATIYFFGAVVGAIFISGKTQSWALPEEDQKMETTEMDKLSGGGYKTNRG